jgi:hypothetical protein
MLNIDMAEHARWCAGVADCKICHPRVCVECEQLAAELGDIYCSGCREGIEYQRQCGALVPRSE